MEEFADVFPEKLPPDRGDAIKIETDPTATLPSVLSLDFQLLN